MVLTLWAALARVRQHSQRCSSNPGIIIKASNPLINQKIPLGCLSIYWRRGRDSNPRTVAGQRFSRPPLSTTQPPLQTLYELDRMIPPYVVSLLQCGLNFTDWIIYRNLCVFSVRMAQYFRIHVGSPRRNLFANLWVQIILSGTSWNQTLLISTLFVQQHEVIML